jgi:hypothetical protein
MADGEDVSYGIDADDRLAFFSPAWDELAAENGARDLQSEKLISRSIWDFISDETTRHLYREIIMRVRAGHRARFGFRCDSPDRRLLMVVDARPIMGQGVGFRVKTLPLEERAPQPRSTEAGEPGEAIERMCSWCKRVPDGNAWIELEAAAEKFGIFESPVLPRISHGMCEECGKKILAALQAWTPRNPDLERE